MKRVESVLKHVLKYFGIYSSIAISVVVAMLDIFGVVDTTVVNSAILAVLALVSGNLLVTQREAEKTREFLLGVGRSNLMPEELLKKYVEVSELISMCAAAKQVLISGTGHTVLVPVLKDRFRDGLPPGLEMRVLLMDPCGDANKVAAFRARKTVEASTQMYKENLSLLHDLAEGTTDQRLQVRVLDTLPAYNIFAFDPHLPTGVLHVHLSSWRTSMVERPLIVLTKQQNLEWFEYFVREFETMWTDAGP